MMKVKNLKDANNRPDLDKKNIDQPSNNNQESQKTNKRSDFFRSLEAFSDCV
ncbi:MAG: hypothetical protein VW731_03915 [Methylophilaceae bacterium]|jgi:hypothetical protein